MSHLPTGTHLQEPLGMAHRRIEPQFQSPNGITHLSELPSIWKEIKTLGDNVSLYPANYNVEKVRWALQSAKILSAEKMHGDTALKWALVLDGNQRVLYKPSLQ